MVLAASPVVREVARKYLFAMKQGVLNGVPGRPQSLKVLLKNVQHLVVEELSREPEFAYLITKKLSVKAAHFQTFLVIHNLV